MAALALAVLPGLLGISSIAAYLVTTVAIGLNNYFLLGRVVFKRGGQLPER